MSTGTTKEVAGYRITRLDHETYRVERSGSVRIVTLAGIEAATDGLIVPRDSGRSR